MIVSMIECIAYGLGVDVVVLRSICFGLRVVLYDCIVLVWFIVLCISVGSLSLGVEYSSVMNVIALSILGHSLVSLVMFYCVGVLSESCGYRSIGVLHCWLFSCSLILLVMLLSFLVNIGLIFSVSYYYEVMLVIMLSQFLYGLGWMVYYNLMVILSSVFMGVHCRLVSSLCVITSSYHMDLFILDVSLLYLAVGSCFYSFT
jgi:hypothetical protein